MSYSGFQVSGLGVQGLGFRGGQSLGFAIVTVTLGASEQETLTPQTQGGFVRPGHKGL